jgi:micrococcal nuclease
MLAPKNQGDEFLLNEPPLRKQHTYRVWREIDHCGKEARLLDLGFHTFTDAKNNDLKRFPIGTLVAWNKEAQKFELDPEKDNLYFYEAKVERVVDGDTLFVMVRLGFGIVVRQYLRLNGLNAPEIKTVAGNKARDFIKRQLGDAVAIQFHSRARDPFDRYLSDVWIRGKYLNNLLLEEGLARRV